MFKSATPIMLFLLALFLWSLVGWLWFAPPNYLIGQPLAFYGLLFFSGGVLSAGFGLAESHESIRSLASKNKLLLLMIVIIILVSLFPPDIMEPYYPPAPADDHDAHGALIPIPIGLPPARAACSNRCTINVCTRWVPGPSQQCPNPGPGGGCCLETDQRCDPDCSDPDPPPPSPPSITGTVACQLWGNNGWCRDGARLVLTASDPQGYSLSITGDAGGPFSCSGSCTVALPEGAGTANYTVTASGSGLSDSGSISWKYDPQPPSPDLSRASALGLNGWYVSPVQLTAIGSDTLSGLANVSLSVDGGPGLASATLGDGSYTVVVTAVDHAGNADSITRTISVDTVAPALMATQSGESGSNGWYVTPVTVSTVSADVNSGIAFRRYRVDGGEWQAGMGTTISADGAHTVDFSVSDNAGNTATTSEFVRLDQTAPSSRFTSPASHSEVAGVVEISGQSNDETSGLVAAEISFDGRTWNSLAIDEGNWTYTWDTTKLSNGTYTLLARGTDRAGNREDTARLIVVVANSPPKVEIPPSWMVWQTVPVTVQPRLIRLGGAQIVIYDPLGRWPARRFTYEPGHLPTSFHWDRRFHDSTLAPAGTYAVRLEAWDVFGNSDRDVGNIVIPNSLVATSTSTIMVTASPTASLTPPPTQLATAAPAAASIVGPRGTKPIHSETPLLLWPLTGLIGWFAGLSAASFADPRPLALRRLGSTLDEIVDQNHIEPI